MLLRYHQVVIRRIFNQGRIQQMHQMELQTEEQIFLKQFQILAHCKYNNSPLFVLKWKEEEVQIVQDFRALNDQIKIPYYTFAANMNTWKRSVNRAASFIRTGPHQRTVEDVDETSELSLHCVKSASTRPIPVGYCPIQHTRMPHQFSEDP